jgi:hypothetical protein
MLPLRFILFVPSFNNVFNVETKVVKLAKEGKSMDAIISIDKNGNLRNLWTSSWKASVILTGFNQIWRMLTNSRENFQHQTS